MSDHSIFTSDIVSPVSAIVGPSHVLRWQEQVINQIVRCDLHPDKLFGRGGLPIWSKRLFDTAASLIKSQDQIGVMVGDFRFGNSICLTKKDDSYPTLIEGFSSIDSMAISPEYDQQMLKRSMDGLAYWHKHFGIRARYIFWCLFCRQVQDRLAGRYVTEKGYKHPTFNYSEVVGNLAQLEIVDLSPLLRMPMHEVNRLFIDSSCHPSRIGYLLLNASLVNKLEITAAYRQAINEVENDLFAIAKDIIYKKNNRVLITGRSTWLDTLMRYMGATGVERLAKLGLILAPLDKFPGQMNAAEINECWDISDCAVIVISAGGKDLSHLLAKAFGNNITVWQQIPVLDWETNTIPIIQARKETPHFTRINQDLPSLSAISCQVRDSMVELGPGGLPTWAGLEFLLKFLAESIIQNRKLI